MVIKYLNDWWQSMRNIMRFTSAHSGLIVLVVMLTMILPFYFNYEQIADAPDTQYINYTSFVVDNTVTKGNNAHAVICRYLSDDALVTGDIEFDVIDEKNRAIYSPPPKSFSKNLEAGATCTDEYLPTSELEPGTYQARMYRSIRVRTKLSFVSVEKHSPQIKSNTFIIR